MFIYVPIVLGSKRISIQLYIKTVAYFKQISISSRKSWQVNLYTEVISQVWIYWLTAYLSEIELTKHRQ